MSKDDRWDKLKAGLYDAIYGKGLAQPYLDATARLMDELRDHTATLERRLADAAEASDAAVEARDVEWQEHLAVLHPNHSGDGCDSGDPRDWTLAAIRLAIDELIDERDEAQQQLAEANADLERARDELADCDNAMLCRFDPAAAESTDLFAWIQCMRAENKRLLADRERDRRDMSEALDNMEHCVTALERRLAEADAEFDGALREAATALQAGAQIVPPTHSQWFGDIACRLRNRFQERSAARALPYVRAGEKIIYYCTRCPHCRSDVDVPAKSPCMECSTLRERIATLEQQLAEAKADLERVRLDRERIRARAAVLMSAMSEAARDGRDEWAQSWVRKADSAAMEVHPRDFRTVQLNAASAREEREG